jgi:ABC-type transport system involved in multi-copper enzyme maturation permease subunit
MSALRSVQVIARMTLLEAIRNRLLLVVLAFGVVLVGMSVAAASVSVFERDRLIIDVGLAAASAFGSIIAIGLTITTFVNELQGRTAYITLSRPLPRYAFVLGKYFGVWLAMVGVVTLMILATALTVQLFGGQVGAALWGSLFLAWFEMALVCAIAMLFATLSSPVIAATYSAGFIVVGNLASEFLWVAERLEKKGNMAGGQVMRFFYEVVPDLEKLSLRPQAANHLEVPEGFLGLAALYALSYATTLLLLAIWNFGRRVHL